MNIQTTNFLEIHPADLLSIESIQSAQQYKELQEISWFLIGWLQAEIDGIADPIPEQYAEANGHVYKLLRDYELIHLGGVA